MCLSYVSQVGVTLQSGVIYGTPFFVTKVNYTTGVTVARARLDGSSVYYTPSGEVNGTTTTILACNPLPDKVPEIQPIVGAPVKDTLLPNQCLFFGHSLTSASGCFSALFQPDGNLVLRKKNDPTVLFETKTANTASFQACLLGTPGNLVVYALGNLSFDTKTSGGASVKLDNDGNLVVYAGASKLWTSNSTQTNITC
jgi:hypothetical protein